jgi:proteasome lid subunit RPN8/RPN11
MNGTGVRLSEDQWKAVVLHLTACLPEEGCGLLGGNGSRVQLVLPIENAEHSPVHYFMEPRALVAGLARLETGGLDLVGAFHSHPAGPLGVSDDDVREWQYPGTAIVVCVPGREEWEGRAFLVEDGRAREVPLEIGIE